MTIIAGTLYTFEVPKGDLEGLMQALARCDGIRADSTIITWEQCQEIIAWYERTRQSEAVEA